MLRFWCACFKRVAAGICYVTRYVQFGGSVSLAIIQGYATFDWCVKHFGDWCHIPAIVALFIIVSGSVTGLPFIMPRNLNGGRGEYWKSCWMSLWTNIGLMYTCCTFPRWLGTLDGRLSCTSPWCSTPWSRARQLSGDLQREPRSCPPLRCSRAGSQLSRSRWRPFRPESHFMRKKQSSSLSSPFSLETVLITELLCLLLSVLDKVCVAKDFGTKQT